MYNIQSSCLLSSVRTHSYAYNCLQYLFMCNTMNSSNWEFRFIFSCFILHSINTNENAIVWHVYYDILFEKLKHNTHTTQCSMSFSFFHWKKWSHRFSNSLANGFVHFHAIIFTFSRISLSIECFTLFCSNLLENPNNLFTEMLYCCIH